MKKSTSTKKAKPAPNTSAKKKLASTPSAKAKRVSRAPKGASPRKKAGAKSKSAKEKVDDTDKGTIAKQVKAAVDAKVAAEEKSAKPSGFSMDDIRRILKEKAAKSTTVEESQKKIAQKSVTLPKAKQKKKKFSAASVSDILGFNPSQKKSPEAHREAEVPQKFLSYYRVLIKLRDELREGLGSHAQETLLTSSKEESGDLSTNSSDAGSESFNRDIALSMVASEQEALNEVEAAIDRIFDGGFGICQETGKSILRDRLKAVPFTRFSLEGQALHEQNANRQVQRGGIFTNLSESVPGMQTDGDA